jgi:RNA polymerase sigma factor (sigma-70 family)
MELSQVIEGCINNKIVSQEVFFKMYYRKLLWVSIRMSPNRDIAEDLLQDAFIKIFKTIDKLNNHKPAGVHNWCKLILRNTIVDYYRKNKNIESSFDDNFDIPIEEESDMTYLESKNIKPSQITNAIENLTPQYRKIFNLYVMEGYSHQEISEKLQITVGASKSNLSRAKLKLRKELELC